MNRSTARLFQLVGYLGVAILVALTPLRCHAASANASPATSTSASAFAANFTETRSLAGINQPLVLHGTLRFTPGKHLLWAVTKPYRYSFEIADGQLTEIMPDGSRKTNPLAQTPWAEALFKLFSGLFSGDDHALSRYFDIHKKADELVLTPRSEVLAKWVTRITARGQPLPREVTIEQSDGGKTHLTLTPLGKVPSVTPPATTQ